MQQDKKWTNALLKWVYGIDFLDEYRYQQVALIGNTCFIIYFFGSFASIILSIGLMKIKMDWAMDFLIFSHLGLLLVTTTYLTYQCRKRGLLVVDSLPEDYETEKVKRLKRNRRNSFFYFVFYHATTTFMKHGFALNTLMAELLSPPKIINSLVMTLIFHYIMKHQTLKNIRILTEDEYKD
ncbi:DUF3278 domain-containing protein [Streptococcus entericus]|uniref:DUF3278 domain-containing protein n=1 Tax=Streptococcus entericus TaxID=155680 RepID=UPI00036F7905|nr:DUF3278 domain-containing protein [Streptococcus entericus]